MLVRTREILTFAACALWAIAGTGLPWLLLPFASRPSGDELLLVLGATALALAFSVVRFEFRANGQRLSISPDSGFLILVALVVAPPWAALVGGLSVLHAIRRAGTLLERVFLVAGGALASGLAAVAANAITGGTPAGRIVVAAACAAALVRTMVWLAGNVLIAEARVPGGGRAMLRSLPVRPMLVLEVGLPVAMVCMAGPFLGTPPLALIVALGGQGITWLVLRLLHLQHQDRVARGQLLETFHQYVPRHVARAILEHEGDDEQQDIPLVTMTGQQRDVTVMFIDIRGFTGWAERTRPAEVLAELNLLLGNLAEEVLATDGTIDKFTGDGLMVFWNAPVDQADHATRAVRALPGLLMRVHEFNLRRESQRSGQLEVGIGIASGPAMVGNVGNRDRLAYTAIGDTVNLASRLEAATRDRDVPVLLAESTFLALPQRLQRQMMRLDTVNVKGRIERVPLYTPESLVRHRQVV
jgi:class 3 adenylate cyclase